MLANMSVFVHQLFAHDFLRCLGPNLSWQSKLKLFLWGRGTAKI